MALGAPPLTTEFVRPHTERKSSVAAKNGGRSDQRDFSDRQAGGDGSDDHQAANGVKSGRDRSAIVQDLQAPRVPLKGSP
jgi:hypothetical protein